MRSALTSLLDLEADLTVVGGVERGDEVISAAQRLRPDIVLLDIELPGRSGLDVIAPLLEAVPDCEVVVVTTFGRPGYLARALAAGARGFLVKDDPVEQLAAAIRRVRAGERVVDPQVGRRGAGRQREPAHGAGVRRPACVGRGRHGGRHRSAALPVAEHSAQLPLERDRQARRTQPHRSAHRRSRPRLALSDRHEVRLVRRTDRAGTAAPERGRGARADAAVRGRTPPGRSARRG